MGTGEVYFPQLSASGYGKGKEWPDKAPGDLGTFTAAGYAYNGYGGYGDKGYNVVTAEVDKMAGVDLSGTWSVIGRSLVISTIEGKGSYGASEGSKRLGCYTIGIAEADHYALGPYAGPAYGGASYGKSYGGASHGKSYSAAAYAPSYAPYNAGNGYW